MSDPQMPSAMDPQARAKIATWVEAELGGKVTSVLPIYRERLTWTVDYEVDGVPKRVLAKGRRPWDACPFPLETEMKVNQVLAANGITVPAVYGMLDDPHVFFMEWVESDERENGLLAQTADGDRGTLSPDRWAASLKYIEELARMHAIPADAFDGAGMAMPSNPTELATGLNEPFFKMMERRIEPPARSEFFRQWLLRNAPQHRTSVSYVAGDACQFLSKGPDVVALLDFELGYLGDPLQDLACFRARHPVENLGDIYALFRRYAEVTGEPLDLPVLAYQTVQFLAAAITGVTIAMKQRHPNSNPTELVSQIAFSFRRGLEAMAELVGLELADVDPPRVLHMPYGEDATEGLIEDISRLSTGPDFLPWQKDILGKTPRFIGNCMALGPWFVEESLADIREVTGTTYTSLPQADRALREFVKAAGPERDPELIRLFHRAAQRECWLIAGPHGTPDSLIFTKLEPILSMRTE